MAKTALTKAEILFSGVICKQPGRLIGWPSITKTPGGELLAAFSGDRDAHACPFGKLQMVRSLDNGKTWSAPETISDSPLDDRDAGIIALSDGTLIARWFTWYVYPDMPRLKWIDEQLRESWRPYVARITEADIARWTTPTIREDDMLRGYWIRRSTDNGETWEPAIATTGMSTTPPVELSDKNLLMIGNDGYAPKSKTSRIMVERSEDHGRSWQVIARLSMYINNGSLGEPHLVEVEPGRLVAMARWDPYRGGKYLREFMYLYQAESDDGGETWTEWRKTEIWANVSPPHLMKLADGRLLVTYGFRKTPAGARACLSQDNGKTWDIENEVILNDDATGDQDLGYAASAQLDDSTIYTVYYQPDKPEEKPCLMATHWRLPA